mgnify:CR=1 FL=1
MQYLDTRSAQHQNRPRYLYLRRYPGEAIVIFDDKAEVWVHVLEIDADDPGVILKVTGLSEPLRLDLHEDKPVLQGVVRLKLQAIQETTTGAYVSIGISAPRNVMIRRDELIRGATLEERREMVR